MSEYFYDASNYLTGGFIRGLARTIRRELDAEFMATHTFYSNGVKFKLYLN
jgi:hypothetical protein